MNYGVIPAEWWEEEISSFPWGGGQAALWVVRQDGNQPDAPLSLLLCYQWGSQAAAKGRDRSQPVLPPPLSRLQRTLLQGAAADEVLARPGIRVVSTTVAGPSRRQSGPVLDAEHRLWTEPIRCKGSAYGAMAIWYRDRQPWRDAVRLWGDRFASRLAPLLDFLPSWSPPRAAGQNMSEPHDGQISLFPAGVVDASLNVARKQPRRLSGHPLPRPVFARGVPGGVGVSRDWQNCCAMIDRIAVSGVNVLLRGESGTGKEIIAQAIHQASPRQQGPLVGQNCAALPETLFESELFGHKAGAFTGAAGDKMGLLEAAHGGTFFLDEVGDMPLTLQIKLLRVMQERKLRRVGELQSRQVDIRFVAATHKDLDREVAAGRFRLDLYYRLKVVSLTIPPLRQRPEDITHLLAYFLGRYGSERGRWRISDRALAALQAYRWPGNVRELENQACRILALYPDIDQIHLEHLSDELRTAAGYTVDPADLATLRKLDDACELLERYLIRKAIAATGGRKAAAARRLGLSRQGLYKKIQRYGMADLIGAVASNASNTKVLETPFGPE